MGSGASAERLLALLLDVRSRSASLLRDIADLPFSDQQRHLVAALESVHAESKAMMHDAAQLLSWN